MNMAGLDLKKAQAKRLDYIALQLTGEIQMRNINLACAFQDGALGLEKSLSEALDYFASQPTRDIPAAQKRLALAYGRWRART